MRLKEKITDFYSPLARVPLRLAASVKILKGCFIIYKAPISSTWILEPSCLENWSLHQTFVLNVSTSELKKIFFWS